MSLTLAIISFNTKDLLEKCLNSIFGKKWKTILEVYVVDNNSTDGSVEMIKQKFPQVKLIANTKNLGFSVANNQVLKVATTKYSMLLNSDTQVLQSSLDNLVTVCEQRDFAIASCELIYPDSSFQPNVGDLPSIFPVFVWFSGLDDMLVFFREKLLSFHRKYKSFYQGTKEVGWVAGTAMIIREDVLKKIGLLDENIFMYGEDVEFCMRAKDAGFKVGWTDKARIIHVGGGSSKTNPSLKQWSGELKGLLYIYQKHIGALAAFFLKIFIYFFIIVRILAFSIIGRWQVAKIYANVLFTI